MARKPYRVLVGVNYPPNGKGEERRAEPGDIVHDLPPAAVEALANQGVVELVKAAGGPVSRGAMYLVGDLGPEGLREGGE